MKPGTKLEPQIEPFIEQVRRRGKSDIGQGSEGKWPPVWMTTYCDLTNLLLTFFVLWYAITMMNIPWDYWKYMEDEREKLRRLEAGQERFQAPRDLIKDTLVWEKIEQMTEAERLRLSQVKTLKESTQEVKNYLEQGELKEGVEMKVVGEDVVIVPTASLLFNEGSDLIKQSFYPVLDKIAQILKDNAGSFIRIEGHTDDTPIHPKHQLRFPSNYELSAARAISVARYLIDRQGIPPDRISVAGYGPLFPKVRGEGAEEKSTNRRVEFHISLSSETASKG